METTSIKLKLSDSKSAESIFKTTLLSKEITREKFEQIVSNLSSEGWNRKKFYDVCMYLYNNENLSEEEQDSVNNFLDELTGFTSTVNIIKLPGEPEDSVKFLEYVHSDCWKD